MNFKSYLLFCCLLALLFSGCVPEIEPRNRNSQQNDVQTEHCRVDIDTELIVCN